MRRGVGRQASTTLRLRSLSISCRQCWNSAVATCRAHVQGRSLTPILTGERQQLEENWGFIETAGGEIGVRTPTHVLGMRVAQEDDRTEDKPRHFYDLRDDPFEMNNLAGTGQQPQIAAKLDGLLRAWHADTPWMKQTSED